MFKIKEYLPDGKQRKWFFFTMLVLFLFYPYMFVDWLLPFLKSNIFQYAGLFVVLVIANLFSSRSNKMPAVFWLLLFVICAGDMLSFVVNGSKFYYHRMLVAIDAFLLISLVERNIGLISFFKVYNKWILLMAILGTIGFFIALIGVPPVFEFESLNDGRTVSSWIITFSKANLLQTGIIRYSGFFDESGAMGFWTIFALALNRLTIKDLKLERMLMIFPLFTFSMGFIFQIIFFIAYFYLVMSKTKSKMIIGILMGLFVVGVYSTKNTEYSEIYDKTVGRFEAMAEGANFMENTSRELVTDRAKELYNQNKVWGIGWDISSDAEYIGDNIYDTLAHDGIVGTIYLHFPYLLFLFWGFKRRDYNLIGVVLFCALTAFHRPIQANILTYFVFFSLPLVYLYQNSKSSI